MKSVSKCDVKVPKKALPAFWTGTICNLLKITRQDVLSVGFLQGYKCLDTTVVKNSLQLAAGEDRFGMVWKESGKFGINTGRTLRKSAGTGKALKRGDCGFLIKTVKNQDINFTDEHIRSFLKKFQIEDGLDEDSVVKESRNDRQWHFGRGGYQDDKVLYSLGKRKRWLMSTALREKIPDEYDSENDWKVVLVERVSSESSWYCSSPRFKRGDCSAVLEGEDVRKPKRRKFAHVGDLRPKSKDSNKTEIVYEVNQTECSSCWPSYLENDWRESRDQNKARCKQKGVKNKRRLWGEFGKYELNRTSCEFLQERLLEHDLEIASEKEKHLVQSSDNFEHRSTLEKRDFDIGNYICEVLAATPSNNGHKNRKMRAHKETKVTTVNPASSQLVHQHGKGSAVHIDSVDIFDHFHDNPVIDVAATASPSVPVTAESLPQCRSVSVDVDIKRDKLDLQALEAQFGEMYKEGDSVPRRFSVCPGDQSSKFVFTCQPNGTNNVGNRTERVTVTIVSDALPSQKSCHCKEFLKNFFGVFEQERKIIEESPPSGVTLEYSPSSNDNQLNRIAVMPFDLLCDVNRWSYEASSPSLALPDVLTSNTLCSATEPAVADEESKVAIIPETIVCEVCCCEFYYDTCDETRTLAFSCTAMKSCLHWFCNECWEAYLSAQLQQGKISIKCPAYDCNAPVDDVTLMGLLPDKFLNFLTMRQEKAVEMSCKWKWCPGNKCNLVVMATSHKGTKDTEDKTVPVPIHCHCGHNWCFACQEEPHWPASCSEAAFFRSQTETYEKIVKTNSGGITSVNVKRCPHCSYPIEKNQGCPHMICAMCNGEFCWTCLGSWTSGHWSADCNQKFKEEEEVELVNNIGSTRFNTNLRVAIANHIARAGPMLYKKYSAVKKLEGVLQSHDEVFDGHLLQVKRSTPSTTSSLLSLYNSHRIPKYLKMSADFKFQTHFVIEGVSVLMAVSKTKSGHDKLKKLISTLLFVADRLEDVANSRKLYSQTDKVHFKMLFKAGKQCIDCVRKVCIKIHQY